ncbi:unnamed protein product [Trichobilharzia szidati]|nr:unnamed protein product [Trichobilharzia szidati]
MLKEKTCFLFRWISLKVFGESFNPKFLYPVVENDEGLWELNHSFIVGLSSYELYSGISQIIEFNSSPSDFSSLLEELAHLCGGRRLVIDSAVLESYVHELLELAKDRSACYKSEFQNSHVVQPSDLIYPHIEMQRGDYSQAADQLNLIWLASHIALIEMILRIYLLKLITPEKLVSALSTIAGCQVNERAIKGLQGADGALFWLVTVAARTVTILGINDCTEWLINHLINEDKSNDSHSPASSCDSANTINTDSLKESADIFLRGLAMANLVALSFHFYCPELAPAEDFLFNFLPTGEMEQAASHHNARAIASVCQQNSDLHNVLFLMPDSCNGNTIRLHDSRSTTLSALNLLGFCSQGLARSPTHRRLQHAAMAGELFVWFTSRVPSREVNSLLLAGVNYKANQLKVTTSKSDINKKELNESINLVSDTDENQMIDMIPLDRVTTPINSDCTSVSGRATYRLDENVPKRRTQQQQQQQQQQQAGNFNRSKTVRLNRNQSDVEKLHLRLNELSTNQLVNSKTGGIFLPESKQHNTSLNHQDSLGQMNDQGQPTTKWNPLEALFRPPEGSESPEVFTNVPSTENHVAETESIEHRTSEVMPSCSISDYWPANTPQCTKLNAQATNIRSTCGTNSPNSVYPNGYPITENIMWVKSPEFVKDAPHRHRRSLSHSEMLPAYSSFHHKNYPVPTVQAFGTYNDFERLNQNANHHYKHHHHHTNSFSRSHKTYSRKKCHPKHCSAHCVDGYSDSDINASYYRKQVVKHASSDCFSSSEESDDSDVSNPYHTLHKSHLSHQHCQCCAFMMDREEIRGKLSRNKVRQSCRSGRSVRRRRNIPEKTNPTCFYASPPFQSQFHCMYPYEPPNQAISNMHCVSHAPVQPTWIRPPYMMNTQNSGSLYMCNEPTLLGSPQFPTMSPQNDRSPVTVPQSIGTHTLKTPDSRNQDTPSTEANDLHVNTTKESITPCEVINSQTNESMHIPRPNIPIQSEFRSDPVEQHGPASNHSEEISASVTATSSEMKIPVSYSQAQSFFIPFGLNSSNVSTTFHHKHNFKSRYPSSSKSRNQSLTDQPLNELKHNDTSATQINNSSQGNSDKSHARTSTEQLEEHISSSPNRITSSSDAIEKLNNDVRAPTSQYADNNEPNHHQGKETTQERTHPRRNSILPSYLEKRSLKASEKETRNSDDSRPPSGKSENVADIHRSSIQTNNNPVNKSKVFPVHQRRTASVSRTIGVVKPNINGVNRRHTQDELSLLDVKSQVNSSEDGMSSDLKLFVQLQTKSNRRAIANALNYCCLAGPVNESMKRTALEALGCSDGKHFMILLKSHCQYSGLYNFSPIIEIAVRISGTGPSKIENSMVDKYYKYDSGLKRFVEINSTSHLSTVVDAILLYGRTRNSTKSYTAHTTSSSKCPLHTK